MNWNELYQQHDRHCGAQDANAIKGAWNAVLKRLIDAGLITGAMALALPFCLRIRSTGSIGFLYSKDGEGKPAFSFEAEGRRFRFFLEAEERARRAVRWTVHVESDSLRDDEKFYVALHFDTRLDSSGRRKGRGPCSEPAFHGHVYHPTGAQGFRFPLAPLTAGQALEWVLACCFDLLEPAPWPGTPTP